MEPVVSISKVEWEAFLAENSKLVQKHKLVLSELELAKTRMIGLQEKIEQQIAKSSEALRQINDVLDRLSEETERDLNESE